MPNAGDTAIMPSVRRAAVAANYRLWLAGSWRARASAWALPATILLGFVLRLLLLATPQSYYPDEIFQYLEPAHKLAFGYGVTTWEYRYGARGWLVPLALSGPMRLGEWLSHGTGGAYILLTKIALVSLSLGCIAAAAALGRRISPVHGTFAALIVAIWSEFAYFATQAISEAIAVSIILPAAAILCDREKLGRNRLILAGALLALGTIVRFQYGPAVALFVIASTGVDRRRWTWILVGAAAILCSSGIIDVAMGQAPFGWLIENVRQNVVNQRSHAWGVEGPLFFLEKLGVYWSYCLIPILLLAWVGAKRYPALLVLALANLATHMLIAHKEYRYILLSTLVVVVLAAIGTVDAIRAAQPRMPNLRLMPIALAAWIGASALTAMAPYDLRSMATPKLEAFAALRGEPRLCGVALSHVDWFQTGGYAYLHRRVPLYVPDLTALPDQSLNDGSAAYDAIVAGPTATAIPAGFARTGCFGSDGRRPDQAVCVYRRAGGCNPGPAARFEINRALIKLDQ